MSLFVVNDEIIVSNCRDKFGFGCFLTKQMTATASTVCSRISDLECSSVYLWVDLVPRTFFDWWRNCRLGTCATELSALSFYGSARQGANLPCHLLRCHLFASLLNSNTVTVWKLSFYCRQLIKTFFFCQGKVVTSCTRTSLALFGLVRL